MLNDSAIVIILNLPFEANVIIKVYDITDREVAALVNEDKTAGRYSVKFNGSNLLSGVYFYSIKAGDFYIVRRLLLVK
ncbi:MAG: T9SS type A sorting domain-containing protein [Bacteroidetes bacterium]|nr:T9SS type A sorting domain-containing protein [Bacteroidota bacterium]